MDLGNLLDKTSQALITVAHGVKENQMDKPTPCADWNVRELINHMIGSFKYFAARAEGKDPGNLTPADSENFKDTIEELITCAKAAAAAWQKPGALDSMVEMKMGNLPGEFAANITLTELLIHGWDLAKATDQKMPVDEKITEEIFEKAKKVMRPEARQSAFGPEKKAPIDASTLDRLAAFLGRQP